MACERNLGMAVDAPRNVEVVDRGRLLTENSPNRDHSLGEADVRELSRCDQISNRPDTRSYTHATLPAAIAP